MKNIFLIVSLLLLNSCGEIDKKEVSKENFMKVLNEYYDRHCIGIDMDTNMPIYEKENSVHEIDKKYVNLEKLGFVKLSDAKFDSNKEYKRRSQFTFFGNSDKEKIVKGKKIELTEKGKKIYKITDHKGRKKAKFCLASYEITAITNYTKPENVMGMTMAKVNYTAKPTKIVAFIDEVSKIDSFKYYKDITTKEISERADLILTEMKGWIHHRDFK